MTETMKIWNAVEKTNPAYTKKVTQRGGFTAIAASSQVMEATRQFGPIGIGWGYDAGIMIFHDNLLFIPVTLWHGDRANKFGPIPGCAEWKNNKGYLDSDAAKKATTDAITKLLSQLGFNADVFLGKFDDNKYIAEVTREFAEKPEYITDAQRDEIADLLTKHNITVNEFCAVGKVKSLKDIQAKNFFGAQEWIIGNSKAGQAA